MSGPPHDRSFNPMAVPPASNYTSRISKHTIEIDTNAHLLIVGLNTGSNGTGYVVEMGAPTTEIDNALRKLILTLLIGLPVVAVIAIAGGFILVRQALKPVEVIRATAQQITFGNPHQRLPVTATGDAIQHLSKTLNQMLERLDLAYQQATRFSADASHELRTPLTIIRSELELIANRQELPPGLRDRVGSVLEETERLSGIVEGLFALARLDAGEAKIGHNIFDLAELVRSTLEQMQLLPEEKHLSVTIDAPQPVFVMGDAARLKQVIVNLLDNAIKYTMAGGAITFFVQVKSSKAILRVRDNGMGISPEALPHVFERFYRADRVRSRTVQGAGLGLSIVRAICQAHGGTVDAVSEEGVGTTVTVELPFVDKTLQEKMHAAA
ncbi:MAG: sensor histidine kinase [Nitrospiria bacterium]